MSLSHEDRELIGAGFYVLEAWLERLYHRQNRVESALVRIYDRLTEMEGTEMGIAESLAQLEAEAPEIKADVEALIAMGQSGQAPTPEQLASLQKVADAFGAIHDEAQAAENPPPAPPVDTPPADTPPADSPPADSPPA